MSSTPKPDAWVPIIGEFDITPDRIEFCGKTVRTPISERSPSASPEEHAAIGLLLSSQTLADGDVSAVVEFDEVTKDSICEIAVSYDENATHLVTAGLGGGIFEALFAIREYGGPQTEGKGWWDHRSSGDRSSLKPHRPYAVKVNYRGAVVSLSLDDVNVAKFEVSSPQGRARQVGLLCKGTSKITVRDFKVEKVKPRAFIVMQFGGQYDDVNDVIRDVCKGYEINVSRADDATGPGLIIGDIIREITESQLIIADVTPPNPNVFFEVGYAIARDKPTILLARKGTSLPFDISAFRVLFYEDSIGGKNRLEQGLRRHIAAIIGNGHHQGA